MDIFWNHTMSGRSTCMQSGKELAREIQLHVTDWSTAGNLYNRPSGVQMPRDICTCFRRYLYATECGWIKRQYIVNSEYKLRTLLS